MVPMRWGHNECDDVTLNDDFNQVTLNEVTVSMSKVTVCHCKPK